MEVSFVHQLTDSERRYGYGDPIKLTLDVFSHNNNQGILGNFHQLLDNKIILILLAIKIKLVKDFQISNNSFILVIHNLSSLNWLQHLINNDLLIPMICHWFRKDM